MPAYLDEKHLSKHYRQYNDVNVSGEVGSTGGLEVMSEVRIGSNVGLDGFALRSVANPADWTWIGVMMWS
jgi:hypothetical protein